MYIRLGEQDDVHSKKYHRTGPDSKEKISWNKLCDAKISEPAPQKFQQYCENVKLNLMHQRVKWHAFDK